MTLRYFTLLAAYFRFIAQKAEKLFQQGADARTSRRRLENDQTEDHAALLPPLEVFANVTQEERAKEFFKVKKYSCKGGIEI